MHLGSLGSAGFKHLTFKSHLASASSVAFNVLLLCTVMTVCAQREQNILVTKLKYVNINHMTVVVLKMKALK